LDIHNLHKPYEIQEFKINYLKHKNYNIMKNNGWVLPLTTLAYSYLFYAKSAGINFLVFTVLLIALQIFTKNNLLKSTPWCIVTAGALVSAVFLAIYGTNLAIVTNVISLGLTAVYSARKSSLLLALLNGVYSMTTAVVGLSIRL
jgi:presenilin-like A22 family membrane protease